MVPIARPEGGGGGGNVVAEVLIDACGNGGSNAAKHTHTHTHAHTHTLRIPGPVLNTLFENL
jgi:hypothetical protein